MAHSCPECDQACYCDGEDCWMEDGVECLHVCDAGDLDVEYGGGEPRQPLDAMLRDA